MYKLIFLVLLLPHLALAINGVFAEYEIQTKHSTRLLFAELKEQVAQITDQYISVEADFSVSPPVIKIEGERGAVEQILSLSNTLTFTYEKAVPKTLSKGVTSMEVEVYIQRLEGLRFEAEELISDILDDMFVNEFSYVTKIELSEMNEKIEALKKKTYYNSMGQRRIDFLEEKGPLTDSEKKLIADSELEIQGVLTISRVLGLFEFSLGNQSLRNTFQAAQMLAANTSISGASEYEQNRLKNHLDKGHSLADFVEITKLMNTFDVISKLKPLSDRVQVFKIDMAIVVVTHVQSIMERIGYSDLASWNQQLSSFMAAQKTFGEAQDFFALERGDDFLDLVITSVHTMPTVRYMAESLLSFYSANYTEEGFFQMTQIKDSMIFEASPDPLAPYELYMGFNNHVGEDMNLKLDPSWVEVFDFNQPSEFVMGFTVPRFGVISCKALL